MLCAGAFWRVTKEDNVLSQTTPAAHGKAAPKEPMTGRSDSISSQHLLEHVTISLDDEKAEDVVSIDLRGKSEIADYMVVCTGRSTRQVTALAEKLSDSIKHEFGLISKIEGKAQGDWVLIDAGDVIIHIFRPEVREFYQLEKMWMSPAEAAAKV
jgi:ribosome-associated protein